MNVKWFAVPMLYLCMVTPQTQARTGESKYFCTVYDKEDVVLMNGTSQRYEVSATNQADAEVKALAAANKQHGGRAASAECAGGSSEFTLKKF